MTRVAVMPVNRQSYYLVPDGEPFIWHRCRQANSAYMSTLKTLDPKGIGTCRYCGQPLDPDRGRLMRRSSGVNLTKGAERSVFSR